MVCPQQRLPDPFDRSPAATAADRGGHEPTEDDPEPRYPADRAAERSRFGLVGDEVIVVAHHLPGQEAWYRFTSVDQREGVFEEINLRLNLLSGSSDQIQHVAFEVYTASGVRNWSIDNRDGLDNVGAGSIVAKDLPPYTLAVGNPCTVIRDRK